MNPLLLKLILLVSVLICIYVLFQLLQKRNSFLHLQWEKQKEGFGMVKNNIVPVNETYASMRLDQYVMKAAFNSAYGNDGQISKENLKRIIEDEGVRVLDFAVYEQNKKPVVGFSNSYDNTIASNNTMPFNAIINTVAETAFQTQNARDPLFIHLRIKSESQPLLSSIAETLENTFREKRYSKLVTKKTKLKTLMNKVVFIMDTTPNYVPRYETILCHKNNKGCVDLRDIININSTDFLSMNEDKVISQTQSPPTARTGKKIKNRRKMKVNDMRMTTPNLYNYDGSNTDSFFKLVHDYGVQVCMHQFYINDDGLRKYKQFFQKQRSAFVPLSAAIAYVANNGGPE